jgi:lysosomal acid lipase/cholesteryl ester hydrolase
MHVDVTEPFFCCTAAGSKDRLGDPADTLLLLYSLPRKLVFSWHHEPDYEHLDFIWGINAATKIYTNVLQILNQLRHVPLSSSAGMHV